jgi:hypothetical protein
LEEESVSKRIDRVEEMTIPSDLEDKLGYISLFLQSLPWLLRSLGMFVRGLSLSSKLGKKSVFWENASSVSARLQRYEAPAP